MSTKLLARKELKLHDQGHRVESRGLERGAIVVALLSIVVLIFYPMLSMLWVSVLDPDTGAFTFNAYISVFEGRQLQIIVATLVYVTLTTIVSLLFGLPLAWAVARTNMPAKGLIATSAVIAYVVPPFLQGMAYTFVLSPHAGFANRFLDWFIGISPFNVYTMTGLVLVSAMHSFAQVFLIVRSSLYSMDASIEEASQTCGASHLQTMRRITMPLVTPAILSATVLAAILTLAQFGVPAVIGLPAGIRVLTTEIYSLLASFPPRFEIVSAFALVFLFFSAILVYLQKRVIGARSFTTVVGRGIRPKQIDIGNLRWPLFGFCLAVVAGALYVPAAVILLISFLSTWGFWLRPGNLTLDNYAAIFLRMGETQQAFQNTLVIGILASLFCVLLGLMVAYLITKSKLPGRNVLRYASFLPTSIPGVVFTVGVILAFISPPIAIYGTLSIIVVTYVARFLPFSVQPLSNSLEQIDDSLLEGSRVSGAGWFGTMRFVTLPLVKYGIFSSLVLIFMTSIREMVSAVLLASQGTQTVLVKIWQFWEEGQTELATALAGVLMVVIALLYGLASRVMRERT